MGPISVSQAGVSVPNATPSQLTFNTKYPFEKIDSTNNASFQNINIFFSKDVPNPNGTSVFTLTTQIYSFAHGYTYIPRFWAMWQRTAGNSTQSGAEPNRYSNYQFEGGPIAASSASDVANFAYLLITADATNVYVSVMKTYDASNPDPVVNLAAYALELRVYVFVEDMSGTSVPSQA